MDGWMDGWGGARAPCYSFLIHVKSISSSFHHSRQNGLSLLILSLSLFDSGIKSRQLTITEPPHPKKSQLVAAVPISGDNGDGTHHIGRAHTLTRLHFVSPMLTDSPSFSLAFRKQRCKTRQKKRTMRRTDGTRINTATARSESSLPQNESKAMHAADPPDDEKEESGRRRRRQQRRRPRGRVRPSVRS